MCTIQNLHVTAFNSSIWPFWRNIFFFSIIKYNCFITSLWFINVIDTVTTDYYYYSFWLHKNKLISFQFDRLEYRCNKRSNTEDTNRIRRNEYLLFARKFFHSIEILQSDLMMLHVVPWSLFNICSHYRHRICIDAFKWTNYAFTSCWLLLLRNAGKICWMWVNVGQCESYVTGFHEYFESLWRLRMQAKFSL